MIDQAFLDKAAEAAKPVEVELTSVSKDAVRIWCKRASPREHREFRIYEWGIVDGQPKNAPLVDDILATMFLRFAVKEDGTPICTDKKDVDTLKMMPGLGAVLYEFEHVCRKTNWLFEFTSGPEDSRRRFFSERAVAEEKARLAALEKARLEEEAKKKSPPSTDSSTTLQVEEAKPTS